MLSVMGLFAVVNYSPQQYNVLVTALATRGQKVEISWIAQ